MPTLTRITREEIRPFIEVAFRDDSELLEKFHISPGTLDHCVSHTLGFINENADYYQADIEFYAVDTVGYTIIIKNESQPHELYSFGINKELRNKEYLMGWLQEVEKLLGTPYYIVLWAQNERAIKFFEKNGFMVQRSSKLPIGETQVLIIKK